MRSSGKATPRFGRNRLRLGTAAFVAIATLTSSAVLTFGQQFCGVALAAQTPGRQFVHPVRGPITRHYEEPPGPYASGHRGIDYGVPAGTPVGASNDGEVKFAGPVAGEGMFITVYHADGIETTYSFLSRIDVKALDRVARGQRIGLSGAGHPGSGADALHFGMKRNGRYIDPEPMLRDGNDISDLVALAPTNEQGSNENAESRSSQQGAYRGPSASGQPGYFSGGLDTEPSPGSRYQAPRPGGKTNRPSQARGGEHGGSSPDLDGHQTSPVGARNPTASLEPDDGDYGSRIFDTSPASSAVSTHWMRLGKFLAGDSAGETSAKSSRNQPLNFEDRRHTGYGWLAKILDKIGNVFDLPGRWLPFDPVGAPTAGLFHQFACGIKGGARPPTMPSTEQLDNHSAAPPPAPNNNIVVVLGGLGSSSTVGEDGEIKGNASMFDTDMRTLGYKPNQIYHYSYKGIEKRGGRGPYRIHALYDRQDTYKRIEASSQLLADQLQEIHEANPGKKIDLVAHSEGGLVADYFVENFFRRNDPSQGQIDHLITIDSPHGGADLARTHRLFADTAMGRTVHPLVQWPLTTLFGAPPSSAPVLGEVQEDSPFIRDLRTHWDPKKVKATTVGSALDEVVTATHTRLQGDDHYTTTIPFPHLRPLASHGIAPTAPATKGIIYNALADRRSKCTAFRDEVAQHVTGPAIAGIEDGLIVGARWTFRAWDFTTSMGDSEDTNRYVGR